MMSEENRRIEASRKRYPMIYALRDPVTGLYRYIGKTSLGRKRARAHLRLACRGEKSHKANWIRKLVGDGLDYEIVVLERPDNSLLNERETWWITLYRSFGHLTNLSDGGLHEGDQRAGANARTRESQLKLARAMHSETAKVNQKEGIRRYRISLTDEQKSEISKHIREAQKNLTPEQKLRRVEHGRRLASHMMRVTTPEQRSANGLMGAKVVHEKTTPEQRSEIARKRQGAISAARKSKIAKDRQAARTPEQRAASTAIARAAASVICKENRGKYAKYFEP